VSPARSWVFLLCLAAAVGFSAAATAAPCAASGGLAVSSGLSAGSFAGVLTGATQTLYADGSDGGTPFSGFSITDDRDTGTGWAVTVAATPFENVDYPGERLDPGSLVMPRLTVASADASCTAPPGELHDAAAVDTGDGVVMVSCTEHGQGMGTYLFSAAGGTPWSLTVGPGAYKGAYTCTVTLTVAALSL
jgi:hypothetical protein